MTTRPLLAPAACAAMADVISDWLRIGALCFSSAILLVGYFGRARGIRTRDIADPQFCCSFDLSTSDYKY